MNGFELDKTLSEQVVAQVSYPVFVKTLLTIDGSETQSSELDIRGHTL